MTTYRKAVAEVMLKSDLGKLLKYEIHVGQHHFELRVDRDEFNNMNVGSRLIATAEISKVMETVRNMGINIYLADKGSK